MSEEILHGFTCEFVHKGDTCKLVDFLVDEDRKLRELCKAWRKFAYEIFDECFGEPEADDDFMELEQRMYELEWSCNVQQ